MQIPWTFFGCTHKYFVHFFTWLPVKYEKKEEINLNEMEIRFNFPRICPPRKTAGFSNCTVWALYLLFVVTQVIECGKITQDWGKWFHSTGLFDNNMVIIVISTYQHDALPSNMPSFWVWYRVISCTMAGKLRSVKGTENIHMNSSVLPTFPYSMWCTRSGYTLVEKSRSDNSILVRYWVNIWRVKFPHQRWRNYFSFFASRVIPIELTYF